MDLEKRKNGRPRGETRLRLLESVVENANDAVVVTEAAPIEEPGPRILYVNDSFVRQTGYRREDVVGRSPRMLQGHGTDPGVRQAIRVALEAGEPFRGELLNYRKDGSTFYTELSILPVRDPKGRLTHWVSVQRDVTARREAEQAALRQARSDSTRIEAERGRSRLANVLDAMEDAFFALDEQWRLTFANRAGELLLGVRRDGVGETSVWPEMEQAFGGEALQLVEKCRSERRMTVGEVCLSRDGRCFLLRASPFEGGASFFLHEITEARLAQETERRLMTIMEATTDLISSAEVDGRLRYLNRAGYRLLGLPEDVPASDLRIEDAHPGWAHSLIVNEAIPTAVANGSWQGETAIRRQDGEEVPVSQVILAHHDSRGGIAYFSTIVRDVSAEKKASEDQRFLAEAGRVLSGTLELRQVMENGARLAIQGLADWSIVALSGDGWKQVESAHADPKKQHLVNDLARVPAGAEPPLSIESVIRRQETKVVEPVTREWILGAARSPAHRRALQKLNPRSMAIVPLIAWGNCFGALALGFSCSKCGSRELVLISELALRLAMTLNNSHLYERSLAATKARDEVLAVVSHDLRNPLESVGLGASFIRERLGDGVEDDVAATMDLMQRSIQRANRLVTDLLEATRAEAGQLEMNFLDEDPAVLAQEAVDLQGETARKKGVILRADIEAVGAATIRADRHRVLQVLTNLLDNAIRHTPAGRSVSVRMRGSRLGARFAIIDTGEGIAAGDLPRVFDRFWTTGNERTTGGVGLGLPISKAIVEAHGGRIRVQSRKGSGSTFRVLLPWSKG